MSLQIYRKQDNYYPVIHWLTSLLAAPFIQVIVLFISTGEFLPGLLTIFWLYFVYGIFYSVPAALIYYFCFRVFASRFDSALKLKIIFNSGAVIAAAITLGLLGGDLGNNLILTYSISIIFCSLLFKPFIKVVEEIPED